jgi:hypothetical protein
MYVDATETAQACTKMMTYWAPTVLDNLTKWKDFLEAEAPSNYTLKKVPDTDVRVDISVIGFGQSVILRSDLQVDLHGTKDGKDAVIQSYIISNPENKTAINANIMFTHSLISGYKDLSLKFSTHK